MAKRPRKETYYSRSADVSNQRLNIALRSSEKVYGDWEVEDARETVPTYQTMTAPTTSTTCKKFGILPNPLAKIKTPPTLS